MKNISKSLKFTSKEAVEIRKGVYEEALAEVGQVHDNVVVTTADLAHLVETDKFKANAPERFFNIGMAEQTLITVSSGLAQNGKSVFAHSFACFLARRDLDQIINSVADPNLDVKIMGTMPGILSPGASHQSIEDISIFRAIPNMTIVDVGDANELAQVTKYAATHHGPMYIRHRRAYQPAIFEGSTYEFELGESYLLTEGTDVLIVASGVMTIQALDAERLLRQQGITAAVLHVPSIKPIDEEGIEALSAEFDTVVTLDNHNEIGGLGSAVGEVLLKYRQAPRFVKIGVPDVYGQAASDAYLYKLFGFHPEQIAETVRNALDDRDDPVVRGDREAMGMNIGGGTWGDEWEGSSD